jgi:hypothetical protein
MWRIMGNRGTGAPRSNSFKRIVLAAITALGLTAAIAPTHNSAAVQSPQQFGSVRELVDFGKDAYSAYKKLRGPYDKANKVIKRTGAIADNYKKCVARGFDPDTCAVAVAWCDFQNEGIKTIFKKPSFVSYLKLDQAFKINCGDGKCFQCCHVPGQGCHTSFIGFPVINCNSSYGIGANAAGITKIVDENPSPVKACLTTPQTCEHIAKCNDTLSQAQLEKLETDLANGLSHPLNSAYGLDIKLNTFGTYLMSDVRSAIDYATTSRDTPTDGSVQAALTRDEQRLSMSIRQIRDADFVMREAFSITTPTDIYDFTTGRGCVNWRSNVATADLFNGNAAQFSVTSTVSSTLTGPSQYNGFTQLTGFRALHAVPNMDLRLKQIESRVWSDKAKTAALARIPNPDTELLKYMSPFALELIKDNTAVQDYRLLALPAPNEPSAGPVFNGCTLGAPPRLDVKVGATAGRTVSITLLVNDPEALPNTLPRPLSVDWGDGIVTQLELPITQSSLILTHTYDVGGAYAALAMVENEAGLRAMTKLEFQTTAGGSPVARVPVFSRAGFRDLAMTALTLSGNEQNGFFEVLTREPTGDEAQLGISSELRVGFNVTTTFGTLDAENPYQDPIRLLILRPTRSQGFYIGLNQIYGSFAGIEFEQLQPSSDSFVTTTLTINPSMIRAYRKGQTAPISTSLLSISNGVTRFPIVWRDNGGDFVELDRIEIDLTPAMLGGAQPVPAANTGFTGSYQEVRPGVFRRPAGNQTFVPLIRR